MAFDPGLFVSTFGLVFLAELPDKTAFATLAMATRSHPRAVFLGVAVAYLVQTVIAVLFGKAISLLPEHWVHMASGVLFLIFAFATWIRKPERAEGADKAGRGRQSFGKTALSAFTVIFIAEWGDLTQLATATMAAKYEHEIPTIFVAAILALWCATAVVVFIGHHAKRFLKPAVLQKVSAAAFASIGALILIRG